MTKYLFIALIVCLAALTVSVRSCQRIDRDRDRLADNQRTLMDKAEYYRTSDSLSAASVERLTLTNGELKRNCGDLVAVAEKLNIKLKRIQSTSTTAIGSEYRIKTVLRDSLVVRDSLILDTLKFITFEDAWLTFAASTANGKNFDTRIETRDTLVQIVHRVPRKFWFFRWGCKAIRQEVLSKNPYSRITFTEYIEVEK